MVSQYHSIQKVEINASKMQSKCCENFSKCCIVSQQYAKIVIERTVIPCDFLMEGCEKMSDSIGSKLQSLRRARGYSQQYVADKVGMKRSTISNYEIDRRLPSLTDLKRVADFYGVGLDYFDLSSTDNIEELLARARDIFVNPNVSQETKDNLYKEIAMLYFKLK